MDPTVLIVSPDQFEAASERASDRVVAKRRTGAAPSGRARPPDRAATSRSPADDRDPSGATGVPRWSIDDPPAGSVEADDAGPFDVAAWFTPAVVPAVVAGEAAEVEAAEVEAVEVEAVEVEAVEVEAAARDPTAAAGPTGAAGSAAAWRPPPACEIAELRGAAEEETAVGSTPSVRRRSGAPATPGRVNAGVAPTRTSWPTAPATMPPTGAAPPDQGAAGDRRRVNTCDAPGSVGTRAIE
ncbi:hypothetical protein SAMN04515671_0929 [Nakamurella panacisegetis]|uniref:Uncharacterized protein n=1 Tax=Nakamurella panacisegetis TaxID=1090615 RepID=A0A1H0JIE0_9ACTN|nr:hypothetical protein [Nakamurella panacisegetis]SDO43565.1 hypothetical protein SAMN04515671_0929 [Nakamurella panacisegetis]